MLSSQTYTFPNTTVKASFLPPSHPGGSYSAIFYENGEAGNCMGSVNAGNSAILDVNGSGINAAFQGELDPPQNAATYQTIHTDLYNHAATGTAHRDVFSTGEPLQYAAVWRPINNTVFTGMEGCVFIDVFKTGLCPKSNPNNYAMIYITPPDGRKSFFSTDAQFLNAVYQMAVNTITAVADFNKIAQNNHNLSDIEVIRTCMFSGNIYHKAGVAKQDIAQNIGQGFADQLAKDATGIRLIEFENADGGFDVVKSSLNTSM